jgi:hypothetical protein
MVDVFCLGVFCALHSKESDVISLLEFPFQNCWKELKGILDEVYIFKIIYGWHSYYDDNVCQRGAYRH